MKACDAHGTPDVCAADTDNSCVWARPVVNIITLIPERSEGLLFHRALDSHRRERQKFQAKLHLKEGKTARYSGHCHRNLSLGSCLVMRGAAKSDAINREIDLEKS